MESYAYQVAIGMVFKRYAHLTRIKRLGIELNRCQLECTIDVPEASNTSARHY